MFSVAGLQQPALRATPRPRRSCLICCRYTTRSCCRMRRSLAVYYVKSQTGSARRGDGIASCAAGPCEPSVHRRPDITKPCIMKWFGALSRASQRLVWLRCVVGGAGSGNSVGPHFFCPCIVAASHDEPAVSHARHELSSQHVAHTRRERRIRWCSKSIVPVRIRSLRYA